MDCSYLLALIALLAPPERLLALFFAVSLVSSRTNRRLLEPSVTRLSSEDIIDVFACPEIQKGLNPSGKHSLRKKKVCQDLTLDYTPDE